MLKKLFKNLNRKKLKVFAFFLVFSFFSWSISKLSQNYDSWVDVNLIPTKFPDSLLLKDGNLQKTSLKLRASGFKLLWMKIGAKDQKVDLSTVSNKEGRFFLTKNGLQQQLENQFSNAEILGVRPDTLFFELYQVQSKKVKVEVKLDLKLAQNFVLVGELTVEPDSVMVKGPSSEIENVDALKTGSLFLSNVSNSFEETLKIVRPENMIESEISNQEVRVSGNVVKFSEKVFELPIYLENEPKGFVLKVFPKAVSLLCKAVEEDLRKFSEEDFRVIATYDSTQVSKSTIRLSITQKPEEVISTRLLKNEVKFVLEPK